MLSQYVATHEVMPSFFQNLFKKDSDDPAAAVADNQQADSSQPNSLLSAMNLPSPFAVSAEEQFMARELIMLMPQQFVRQDAMPGDQLVPLPLEALRVSLQQGRPALRLSQLYMACPSLFGSNAAFSPNDGLRTSQARIS